MRRIGAGLGVGLVLAVVPGACKTGPGASDGASTLESGGSDTESSSADASEDAGSDSGAPAPGPLDPEERCGLLEADGVELIDRVVLHDFDDPVPGCSPQFGPSGVDYHPGLDRIIVASDKGQYALITPDGSEVVCYDLPGDNEGVTVVDPDDPRVVFAVEAGAGDGKGLLNVVDLSTHASVGTFVVDFEGGAVGNDGVEGLAYSAGRDGLPAGFIIGDQTLGEGRSGCAVPWTDSPGDDTVHTCAESWTAGFGEVTGADDDPGRGLLWLSSDDDDAVIAVTAPGAEPSIEIALPPDAGPGQEGHAVVGCTLLLSLDDNDDARKVLRYTLRPT